MDRAGYTHFAVATVATLWFLMTARDVLQPLIVAVFLWFLLNAAARAYVRLFARVGTLQLGHAKLLSAVTILGVLLVVGTLVSRSAAQFADQLPVYEATLDRKIGAFFSSIGMEQQLGIGDLLGRIEIAPAALSALGSAANTVAVLIVVLVYMVFINAEVRMASSKLASLVPDTGRRDRVIAIAEEVVSEIEAYFGIKVLLGIIQAVPTYAVLAIVGVDAPIFWAVLIFLFSFVPTIGTLAGIVFPALMAILQFETLTPFFVVAGILVPVQLMASNYLEPLLMGTSLNISALVVMIGIFAGGAVWGIVGALIIVPVLAVIIIIAARVPSLRPVAVILSADGKPDAGIG